MTGKEIVYRVRWIRSTSTTISLLSDSPITHAIIALVRAGMHVTILGKRYRVRFVPNLGKIGKSFTVAGKCEDPKALGKEIIIRQGLSEKETLDTIIHEVLHAADWHKTEEWIETVATDVTRILWRFGYRKQKEGTVDGKKT